MAIAWVLVRRRWLLAWPVAALVFSGVVRRHVVDLERPALLEQTAAPTRDAQPPVELMPVDRNDVPRKDRARRLRERLEGRPPTRDAACKLGLKRELMRQRRTPRTAPDDDRAIIELLRDYDRPATSVERRHPSRK